VPQKVVANPIDKCIPEIGATINRMRFEWDATVALVARPKKSGRREGVSELSAKNYGKIANRF